MQKSPSKGQRRGGSKRRRNADAETAKSPGRARPGQHMNRWPRRSAAGKAGKQREVEEMNQTVWDAIHGGLPDVEL